MIMIMTINRRRWPIKYIGHKPPKQYWLYLNNFFIFLIIIIMIFKDRVYFNQHNQPAFLQIDPVQTKDAGEYRCRVDFKKARTINIVIQLKVIGMFEEQWIILFLLLFCHLTIMNSVNWFNNFYNWFNFAFFCLFKYIYSATRRADHFVQILSKHFSSIKRPYRTIQWRRTIGPCLYIFWWYCFL